MLAALLPPERALLAGRALAAVEAAHPGVPGMVHARRRPDPGHTGDAARAGALLLEAGRRDLAVGALASAEHTLARAPALTDPGDAALRTPIDEALTEVFSPCPGQVEPGDRAGPDAARPAGPRGSVRPGSSEPAPGHGAGGDRRCPVGRGRREHRGRPPRVTGSRRRAGQRLAAQVAIGQGHLAEADQLARAALRAAGAAACPRSCAKPWR